MREIYWRVPGTNPGTAVLCSREKTAGNWTKGPCLYRISEGVELLRAEIARMRIGRIASSELGG